MASRLIATPSSEALHLQGFFYWPRHSMSTRTVQPRDETGMNGDRAGRRRIHMDDSANCPTPLTFRLKRINHAKIMTPINGGLKRFSPQLQN
ncbi:hypothetical protein BW686_08325 [Pseudomonas syringae]|uniref:Uncharacterized protein n=1 Tax=Pseudomonas syringae TaxID=317 RepID=A0A244EU79_PSESX|nr:hypothetical protein BW686_08325 [Pseudomonas syringae]